MPVTMSRTAVATGLLGLALAVGAPHAGATVMLDQEYLEPTADVSAGASQADGSFRRAMTFTVGLAGTLDHVAMRGMAGSLMRILSTAGGVPTSTVLASTGAATVDVDGWINWDLSAAGLAVTPGDVLAMDMLIGVTGNQWLGSSSAGYAGGGDYFLNVSFGFPNFTSNPTFDAFIRTFVDVPGQAPEPASLALLGLGLAALAFGRRRRG